MKGGENAPECLTELKGLVDNAFPLFVVPKLRVALEQVTSCACGELCKRLDVQSMGNPCEADVPQSRSLS